METLIVSGHVLFISNPPYIPRDDLKNLDESVIQFDPMTALDGGEDGCDIYQKCFHFFKGRGVTQIYEIGYDLKSRLRDLLINEGYQSYSFIKDVHDLDRMLIIPST